MWYSNIDSNNNVGMEVVPKTIVAHAQVAFFVHSAAVQIWQSTTWLATLWPVSFLLPRKILAALTHNGETCLGWSFRPGVKDNVYEELLAKIDKNKLSANILTVTIVNALSKLVYVAKSKKDKAPPTLLSKKQFAHVIGYICKKDILLEEVHAYLIFVISFTQAAFSNSKFYTRKLTKNTPKHWKMSLKSKI